MSQGILRTYISGHIHNIQSVVYLALLYSNIPKCINIQPNSVNVMQALFHDTNICITSVFIVHNNIMIFETPKCLNKIV